MRIIERDEIETALASIDLMGPIEEAFVAYSTGLAVVPPVGELLFEEPPGEVHIKYGYLRGEDHYVVKIASGFYENARLGLPSGDGLMILFEQRTGRPAALLLDRGRLTDVRTAVAGAVAARALAPRKVERIGVLGAGVQARLQLLHLRGVTPCDRVLVWGRRDEAREAYCREMGDAGYDVEATSDPARIGATCNLIVTVTPSREPLLEARDIRSGTHITAVGSDTVGKQELAASVLSAADVVVADSMLQCSERGEIAHGLAEGSLSRDEVVELGQVLAGSAAGRATEDQITVADLTGLAVQDVQAAAAVYAAVAATVE